MAEAKDKSLTTVSKEWLNEHADLGIETITSSDLPVPRLSLVQKTSTKCILRDGNNAKEGLFYYAGTKEQSETFPCALLSVKKEFKPSFTNKEQMEEVWTFIGATEKDWLPFIFSCRRTSLNGAKSFIANVKMSHVPMFSLKVVLESRYIQSQKGNFYIVAFTDIGYRESQEQLLLLSNLAKKYKAYEPMGGEDVLEEEIPPIEETEGNPSGDMPF
ncbi:MAG: hypothetical protein WC549_00490 [Actinomycetota bacterium]